MRKKMDVILLGDPAQGGFRGYNSCGSNNDLAWGQSPNMYNYLVSNTGLAKRKGCVKDNAAEIGGGAGATGLHRHYNGTAYKTFVKIGTRVYDLQATGASNYVIGVTEAGDASNQLSAWSILGANSGNTNAGVLYWSLTNSGTTRTVDLYKNSDGAAENKVATGYRTGDGVIILAAANDSGITGTVTVAYSGDDTTLAANTLTFGTLTAGDEIEFESWASRYFFVDGISMYSGTTGNASAVAWCDEDGALTDATHPSGAWTLLPTPQTLVLHKEHLWWFDKNSSRVGFTLRNYYDRVYENTVSAGTYGSWVACDADDGQYLTALVRAPMSDNLMAFKRDKSFIIDGDYDDTSNTLIVRPGPPCGAYSQKGVITCPDGFVRWYGPSGIWQYRQDTGPMCISRNKQAGLNIEDELNRIAAANRGLCCLGWDSERQYLLFFYPYGSSAYNDRGLAFDVVKMEWMPIRSWNVARLCNFEDGTIHAGWSNAGYVKKLFYGYNDDGAAISCYYETKYYGRPQVESVLDSIRGRVTAGRKLTFGWQSDPGTGISGSVTFAYGTAPVVLGNRENPGAEGTFTLGDKTSPGSGTTISDRNARVVADFARRVIAGQRFREMKFIFSESGTGAHSLDFIEARTYARRLVI
jgi:hypothetical protein